MMVMYDVFDVIITRRIKMTKFTHSGVFGHIQTHGAAHQYIAVFFDRRRRCAITADQAQPAMFWKPPVTSNFYTCLTHERQ